LLREYINTPVEALSRKRFEKDLWRLTAILKAADRRLGREKLVLAFADEDSEVALQVLARRGITHILQSHSR
jgi:hypothetical protein